MKKVLSLVLAAFAIMINSVGAQSPKASIPDKIPIASLETLKMYALTLVDNVQGGVFGQSVSGYYWFSAPYTFKDADPDHMAYVVSAQALSFSVDPGERLELYFGYNGTVSNVAYSLFSSYTNFYLVKGKNGSWVIPPAVYTNKLEVSDWVPFPVRNIQYAYMVLTDEKGNNIGWYDFSTDNRISVDQGLLILGREHLGQRGTLFIGMKDGTKVGYDLGSGYKKPSATIDAYGFKPSIEGIRSVPVDCENIMYQAGDRIIRAQYTKSMSVSVKFPSRLDQYPLGVNVIDLGVFAADPNNPGVEFNPVNEPVKFGVTPNQVIFIRFEFTADPMPLPQPGGGGGKG